MSTMSTMSLAPPRSFGSPRTSPPTCSSHFALTAHPPLRRLRLNALRRFLREVYDLFCGATTPCSPPTLIPNTSTQQRTVHSIPSHGNHNSVLGGDFRGDHSPRNVVPSSRMQAVRSVHVRAEAAPEMILQHLWPRASRHCGVQLGRIGGVVE